MQVFFKLQCTLSFYKNLLNSCESRDSSKNLDDS